MQSNDNYYNNMQLPIFALLFVVMWGFVGVRVWVFLIHIRQPANPVSWKSWRGLSTVLSLLSGFMLTIYYGQTITSYVYNTRILSIRDKWEGAPAERAPETYTDQQVDEVRKNAVVLMPLHFTIRYNLHITLWLTKFAFLALLYETRDVLSKKWKIALHVCSSLVFGTFIVGIAMLSINASLPLPTLTPDIIRSGLFTGGIRFLNFAEGTELILATTNIFTDMLFVAIACKTIKAMHRPIAAASLVFVMAIVTILIAIGRVLICTVNFKYTVQYTAFLTIPGQILIELEAYASVIVSCLPGLRVLIRTRKQMNINKNGAIIDRQNNPHKRKKGPLDMTTMDTGDSQGMMLKDVNGFLTEEVELESYASHVKYKN